MPADPVRRNGKRPADEPVDDDLYEEEAEYDGPAEDEEPEAETEREERRPKRRASRKRAERENGLTAPLAARAAMRHIADLTGKDPAGVTSLERADDGWRVGIEVVEDRRIPSSADVLGLYLTEVDADGSLVTYRRTKRYKRGSGDGSGGA